MKKTTSDRRKSAAKKAPARPGWMPDTLIQAEAKEQQGRSSGKAARKTSPGKAAASGAKAATGKRGSASKGATSTTARPAGKAATKKGTSVASKRAKPVASAMPKTLPGHASTAPRGSRAAGTAQAGSGARFQDQFAEREARRYDNPIASREAILALVAQSEGPQSAEELAVKLQLTAPDRFEALSRRLAAMLRDGQLLVNRRGQYVPADKTDLLAGQVIANPEGFGFVHLDAGGEDLFLPPREMRKVLHGDRVLASVVNVDRRGRREGVIVEVLERR